MPQPKSSRSSSRSSSSGKRAPASTSKRATTRSSATSGRTSQAKRGAAGRTTSAAKGGSTTAAKRSTSTAKRSSAGAAAAAEQAAHANLTALRDVLRRGVVLTSDHVKAAMDDAVKRGRITRKDATELSQSLLSAGRSQADGFRSDLEQLLGRGRDRAALSSDRVLQEVDRARRRVGVGPSFPITLYDELNASQVVSRLKDLTPAQLRKVRDHEKRHDNRKSVLSAIEKRLA
jgi:polyhydroxyalkanoate synthesis regulator phasin